MKSFLALVLSIATITSAFLPRPSVKSSLTSTSRTSTFQQKRILRASVENDVEGGESKSSSQKIPDPPIGIDDVFPSSTEYLTFELADGHRPLGLTIEETLAPTEEYVFVSKIVEGGFAEKAGIQVGDVIVAVTGLFDEVTPVLEAGVDKIKGLVGSVDDEDPLIFQIARGSGVIERHETAVVDLCQINGASDKEVENCVVDFLKEGYNDAAGASGTTTDEEEDLDCDAGDEDAECMLDGMMNLWADELPPPPTTSGISDLPDDNTVKKAKPWSSRSSPSGTFVRDPVTGEMRNLDA